MSCRVQNQKISKPERGDILAIFDVGAYGISMDARLRPRMILTSEEGVFVIRERENYADLIAKDVIPEHLL